MFIAVSFRPRPLTSCVCRARSRPGPLLEQQLRLSCLSVSIVRQSRRYHSTVSASAAAHSAETGDAPRQRAAAQHSAPAASPAGTADRARNKSTQDPKVPPPPPPRQGLGLRQYHYATFFSILVTGIAFLAILLYLQADIQIQQACFKVLRRLFKTVALRQVGL